jgi:hippurate hydrolase
MTIDLSAQAAEIAGWRRHIHAHPELSFHEHGTAAFVAEKLRTFGCDRVETGVGGTGVVATLSAGSSPRSIGLRADMDALPLTEQVDLGYSSCTPGVMHACGHDGHTAMLLGAARYLAATRRFDGTVHLVFQPAEESLGGGDPGVQEGGGALAMMRDGLFERFPMEAIFGMHNRPGLAAGKLGGRPGVIYSAVDRLEIKVVGKGGHAARPHLAVDPILVAAQIVGNLQAVAARMVDPLGSAVVSICELHAGSAFNIIPEVAKMTGTVRTFDPAIQDRVEAAIKQVALGVAEAHGAQAEVNYMRGYPSLHNDPGLYEQARRIARALVGEEHFVDLSEPTMGAEDFACYLSEKPGCFLLIGNGDAGHGSVMLHNPHYEFNDDVAPLGAAFWASLVEGLLPARAPSHA